MAAKQLVRAFANMAYNPEFFPDAEAHALWAKKGEVAELPEFYLDRPDLVQIWVDMGAIELVEPPKVYKPKTEEKKGDE
jgi:hypothetical protein